MAVGLYFAVSLLLVKLNAAFTVNFTADCNIGGDFDCSAVQSSSHSTVLGIPIALWALPTYLMMILLSWFGMQNEAEHRERAIRATNLLVVLGVLSMCYSAYLAYVQAVLIGKRCLYCYGMYAMQLGVLVSAAVSTPSSFAQAMKDGLSTALGGRDILAPAAVTFGLTLAFGLVWFENERDRAYHRGGQDAVQHITQMYVNGDCQEAIDSMGDLTQRSDMYGDQARALLPKIAECAFQGATSIPGSPVQVPPAQQPPSESPQGAAPAPQQPAGTSAAAVAANTAQPRVPTAKPATDAMPTPTGIRTTLEPAPPVTPPQCSGKKSENGYPVCNNIPITDDDFVWGNPNAKVTIVEIADFECAFCRMLSSRLKRVKEKWKDQIRFVFKFYPMDGSCNPRLGGERMHPDACTAAKAAYCAGKQGLFWQAHDKLFETHNNNQPDKVRGYMKELGVNLTKWDECLASQAPQARIRNDLRIAAAGWVWGTPRMYINGRLVSGSSSESIIDYYIKAALQAPTAAPAAAPAPTLMKQPAAAAITGPMAQAKTAKGSFYIDRYEASITKTGPSSGLDPSKQGAAVSVAGVRPAQASWYQAKAACEKAGKRLCTEEEWASACAGAAQIDNNSNSYFNDDDIEGSRYPYGVFHEPGKCHDNQKSLEGQTVATGSLSACKTVSGLFDMTGNIGEWIESDENRASLVGGHFGSNEGAACNRRGTSFGPGIRNDTTGFRCCANTQVANITEDKSKLDPLPSDLVGRQLPPITLAGVDGGVVSSASWKGKVTYLTFFAKWCGSCKRELPELAKWQTEMKGKGFQVVAIGVDRSATQSKEFAKEYGANYAVATDPDAKSMTEFDVSAMPTSFVVDKNGVIRKRIVGFKKEEVPVLKDFIQKLL
jgi:protein-disulfide isomerase/thiol-disulfide isomerase/thioredoxin/uncharacterized membrane protein